MNDGSGSTGYAATFGERGDEAGERSRALIAGLKTVPWTRVVVDVMLLAAMLVVSSKLFTP